LLASLLAAEGTDGKSICNAGLNDQGILSGGQRSPGDRSVAVAL